MGTGLSEVVYRLRVHSSIQSSSSSIQSIRRVVIVVYRD